MPYSAVGFALLSSGMLKFSPQILPGLSLRQSVGEGDARRAVEFS